MQMDHTTPIVVEETYHAPVSLVWQAITDRDHMRQWFFEPITEFQPEIGFETEFDVLCEGQNYPHQWKVTEVVQEALIVYDWRYGGYPGSSSVRWELSETPNGTKLRFTHRGHESFPQDNPIFNSKTCQAGWDYFLHESLKSFLERQDP